MIETPAQIKNRLTQLYEALRDETNITVAEREESNLYLKSIALDGLRKAQANYPNDPETQILHDAVLKMTSSIS